MDPAYSTLQPRLFDADVRLLRPQLLRTNLLWTEIAPQRPRAPRNPADPAYRWEMADYIVRRADAAGVPILVTIWQTPPWAYGTRVRSIVGMPDVRAFRDFVAAAAERYSGRFDPDGPTGGLAPLPRVSHWQIWNEPNVYFYPQREPAGPRGRIVNARNYVRLLNVGHDEIKAVGRRHRFRQVVVAAGLAGARGRLLHYAPLRFLRLMRPWGPRFDVLAVHPYNVAPWLGAKEGVGGRVTRAPNVAIGNVGEVVREVDRLWPRRRVPVWLTEFGLQTQPSRRGVSPAAQARFLADALRILRQYPRIGVAIWFLVKDQPLARPGQHHTWQSGLRFADGRRKPVFDVWRRAQISRKVPVPGRRPVRPPRPPVMPPPVVPPPPAVPPVPPVPPEPPEPPAEPPAATTTSAG
jgi:hypothetical protein